MKIIDQQSTGSSDEAEHRNEFVAELMKQIKEASGLSTNKELAHVLSKYVAMTDKMLSQYLNGHKAMGVDRLLIVANAAKTLGWETPAVKDVLAWEEMFPSFELSQTSEYWNNFAKSESRSKEAALTQFDKTIGRLVEFGINDTDIVGMAAILTEKYIPFKDLTRGGTIHPSEIRKQFGDTNCDKYPKVAWLMWDILGLDEASQYIQAREKIKSSK